MIPNEFSHPLFFLDNLTEIIINQSNTVSELMRSFPFVFELIDVNGGLDFDMPWENRERFIPLLLNIWKEEAERLNSFFINRNTAEAKDPMVRSLALFLSFLFWSNQKRVPGLQCWQESIKTLDIKPINVVERLEFIFLKPNHYHSFVQLSQLYSEFTKQYSKHMALESKKK
jgi:hypothetical protein